VNVRRTYEYALQREREGRDFYQRNAERMSHAAAAGIFRKFEHALGWLGRKR